MSILPVNVFTEDSGSSATDGYTTRAVLTPAAGRLYLVSFLIKNNVITSGLTGAGLTWVHVAENNTEANLTLSVWRAMSPTVGFPGALTLKWSGGSGRVFVVADEITGVNTEGGSGSGAVRQLNTNSNAATASLAVTLAAFGDATNNVAYGVHGHAANEVTDLDASGGYAQVAEIRASARCLQTEWKTGQDTSVSASWASTVDAVGIALELAVPTVAGGVPTNITVPVITGTAEVGQTLTASTGEWAETPTSYAYQWQRETGIGTGIYTDVSLATDPTYILTTADLGLGIDVAVTATNSFGDSTAATSDVAGPVTELVAPVVGEGGLPGMRVEVAFGSKPGDAGYNWTDVTSYCRSISWQRGKQTELDSFQAGTGTVLLNDATRIFDPLNTSSDYYPNVIPLVPARAYLIFTTITEILTGYGRGYYDTGTYEPPGIGSDYGEGSYDTGDYGTHPAAGFGDGAFGEAPFGDSDLSIVVPPDELITVLPVHLFQHYVEKWPRKRDGPNYAEREVTTVDAFELANQAAFVPVKATGGTDVGMDADLVFTAVTPGSGGNSVSVRIVTSSGTTPAVTMSGSQILIKVDGTTDTALDVKATLENDKSAPLLVTIAHAAGSNGSGIMVPPAGDVTYQLAGGAGAGFPAERSDVRIVHALDYLGAPASLRQITAGQSEVAAVTFPEDSRTAILPEMLAVSGEGAEQGMLFINGEGRWEFIDRHTPLKTPATTPRAAFTDLPDGGGDTYVDISPDYGKDWILNAWQAQRDGGTVQYAEDTASEQRYLRRSREVASVRLTSDVEVLGMVQWRLRQFRDPQYRIESVTVMPGRNTDLWQTCASLEIGDRITINENPPGGGDEIVGDYIIQGLKGTIPPDAVATTFTYTIWPADPTPWFVFGADTGKFAVGQLGF